MKRKRRADGPPDSRTENGLLVSDAGWPRPRNGDGYPVPWNSLWDDLGQMSEARQKETSGGTICQVCGQDWPNAGDVAYLLFDVKEPMPDPDENWFARALNDGLLCWRCVRLSLGWCPGLHRRVEARKLRIYQVPTGIGVEIDIRWLREVPLPEFKRLWPTPR